jgi:hypothetical protein
MAKFGEMRDYPLKLMSRHSRLLKAAIYAAIFVLYNAFWIGCMARYITQVS